MRFIVLSLFVSIFLFGSIFLGCCSIIHGTKQNIAFQSSPSGAMVEVKDAMGVSYGSCDTPCSLELKRQREYKVNIYKSGYASFEFVIQRKTDGWVFGNILFGGIIGLIVDFSNGAAYKLSPNEVQTTLSPSSLGSVNVNSKGELSLVFVDFDKLSKIEKDKVSKLPKMDLPFKNLVLK